MDNIKDDKYYIEKILEDLSFMIKHTKDMSQEEFVANELLIDSVMFRLVQVAENSDKLTQNFKEKHKDIPWKDIKGMRNKIVHNYGVVDLTTVYQTVLESVPELFNILTQL